MATNRNNEHKTESEIYREKIKVAREIQIKRQGCLNAKISTSKIQNFIKINEHSKTLLKSASEKLNLSARAIHKILKLSRTIADLENEVDISNAHLLEALQYRKLD
jgi:magnesium chelatase family protein